MATASTPTRQAVLEYIDEERDELIGLLQTMVRTRSVNPAFDPESPGEGAMAELVRARYEAMGMAVELVEAEPGRPNVVATWKGTESSVRMLVNCHLDTHAASLGEWVDPFTGKTVSEWTQDPFGGEIVEGKMYGRGTADHKSPIAAILIAIEAVAGGRGATARRPGLHP